MFISSLKTQLLSILLGSVFLCQCTKAVNLTPTPIIHEKIVNPYTKDSLARIGPSEALLSKAGAEIGRGQWQTGLAILAQSSKLSATEMHEKNLLLADVAMQRGKPKEALEYLAKVNLTAVPSLYHQVRYHELQAEAYAKQDQPLASVTERIRLAPLLQNEDEQKANNKALWMTLVALNSEQLNAAIPESGEGSTLQGWLQLASIAHQEDAPSLLSLLSQWQAHFSAHPANVMLPALESVRAKMLNKPQHLALLLPLTGALAGPGNAIKDGFMAAYDADPTKPDTPVKIYDTESAEVGSVYQQAIQEGADYVIGPLSKNQVATVAALPHPVPTLLLNETTLPLQDAAYWFGLSPADEAIQAARKMRSQGLSRALVIAPADAWGAAITKAFTEEWQQGNGQVVDTLNYQATENMTTPLSDFLQVNASLARAKQMRDLVGSDLQITPSRRQDFDVIFLLAYPSRARHIMPLLHYYYVGDVKVFATSSVYSGNADALKDKDLEGIRFCDIPFVFSHQMGAKNWPEQFNSYNRLYALGMDSYALTTKLNPLLVFGDFGASGTNGTLYLTPSQQITRVFEWGQFRQGLAQTTEAGTA